MRRWAQRWLCVEVNSAYFTFLFKIDFLGKKKRQNSVPNDLSSHSLESLILGPNQETSWANKVTIRVAIH